MLWNYLLFWAQTQMDKYSVCIKELEKAYFKIQVHASE